MHAWQARDIWIDLNTGMFVNWSILEINFCITSQVLLSVHSMGKRAKREGAYRVEVHLTRERLNCNKRRIANA